MKLQNLAIPVTLVPYALGLPHPTNFPEYRSLAGLSPQEIQAVARTFNSTPGAQPLPPPISDTSSRAMYDSEHPYIPDQPGDIRGPCPALNTLASHGYLPRNGVATPAQIVTAVQEGFNMGWNLASFATYATFIVDGNHLTNLMSIGANTTAEGEPTPGLDAHFNVEGDASTTGGDFYFDNDNFDGTLFGRPDEVPNRVGNGLIVQSCYVYHQQVNLTAQLYPDPTPELEAAIKANLVTFYETLQNPSCEQYFPYGQ